MRRPSLTASLKLENLESREVPAIVLQGTLVNGGTAQAAVNPNGGMVTIQEVALVSDAQGTTTNGKSIVESRPIGTFVAVNKTATANDTITLSNNGSTLTVTDTDGIFIKFTGTGGDTRFQSAGNTLDVPNVTNVMMTLQLGGDDNITDNTSFASTIDAGDGADTITVTGIVLPPAFTQFFLKAGGLDFQTALLFLGAGPAKNIKGGAGNDNITVNGFATGITIDGGAGNDTIIGPLFGVGNTLGGGADNDTIVDGFGVDVLDGGPGNDILYDLGGVDFFLAMDQTQDFIFGQKGDFVFADPNDFVSLT